MENDQWNANVDENGQVDTVDIHGQVDAVDDRNGKGDVKWSENAAPDLMQGKKKKNHSRGSLHQSPKGLPLPGCIFVPQQYKGVHLADGTGQAALHTNSSLQ